MAGLSLKKTHIDPHFLKQISRDTKNHLFILAIY